MEFRVAFFLKRFLNKTSLTSASSLIESSMSLTLRLYLPQKSNPSFSSPGVRSNQPCRKRKIRTSVKHLWLFLVLCLFCCDNEIQKAIPFHHSDFCHYKQENAFRHNTCPWLQLAQRERYHLKAENSVRNLCNTMNSNWTTDFSYVVYASDWTNYFRNMRKHHSRLWLARTHLRKKVHDMAFMAFIGLYSIGIITLKNIYIWTKQQLDTCIALFRSFFRQHNYKVNFLT